MKQILTLRGYKAAIAMGIVILMITSCKKETVPPSIEDSAVTNEIIDINASADLRNGYPPTVSSMADTSRLLFQTRVTAGEPTSVTFSWLVKPLSGGNLLLTQDSFSLAKKFIPSSTGGNGTWQYSYLSLRKFKELATTTGVLYMLTTTPSFVSTLTFSSDISTTIIVNGKTRTKEKKIPSGEMLWGTPWAWR